VDRLEIERRLRGRFLLGQACGTRRDRPLSILDATAGLGIDGIALALSGQRVHLVERHPLVWALLVDLLGRLGFGSDDVRLTLGDSSDVLERSRDRYDVIYIDPMFPARTKKALPGKRMQYLAAMLGDSVQPGPLEVERARERAVKRVVLKRRARDPVIGLPDWTIRGKAVRYDVYRGEAGGHDAGEHQPSSSMA